MYLDLVANFVRAIECFNVKNSRSSYELVLED